MTIDELASDLEDKLLSNAIRLPVLPEVVIRITELINDSSKGTSDIVAALQTHQTLAARLLQIANSPALRPSKPITSLHDAVSMIGVSLVRNLALGAALGDVFRSTKPELNQKLRETWTHSVEVGALSFILVKSMDDRRFDPSVALLIGVMHSIGTLPIIDYFNISDTPISQFSIVREALSKKLSAHLLRRWELPESFIGAIVGEPGIYGEVLRYIHGYLNNDESGLLLVSHDDFSNTVNINKQVYDSIAGVFN